MINKKNLGNLNKRMARNATSGNGGGNFSVIDWKKTGNDELKFFKPVDGKNVIDIVPYEIKSKNHPMVRSGESKVGDVDYMLEVWQHTNIGPSKKTVLCLNRMYGKPCPICEAASALKKSGKEEQAKKLYAKQRALYNVVDHKESDVVKIFDVSYKLFEKELMAQAKEDADSDGNFVEFGNPTEDGKSVKFRAEDKNGGDFTFKEFKSFAFIDRDEDLSDDILEQAVSFDELLKIPTYEEVVDILNGEDSSDDDDDEEEQPKKKHHEEEDDDDDEEEQPKKKHHEEEQPKKKHHEEEDDDDEEEEKPKKKHHEEEDDDDEEEQPKKTKCPCGFVFGKDNDEYRECDDCKLWQKCADAQDKMKED